MKTQIDDIITGRITNKIKKQSPPQMRNPMKNKSNGVAFIFT